MRAATSSPALCLGLALMAGCVAPSANDDDSSPDASPDTEPGLLFALPLAEPWLIESVVGYDHDPEVHGSDGLSAAYCTNYEGDGFPACYDEHDGSDFILEGAFTTMDAGSTPVLAAADGVVVSTEADQYDRCHATLDGVSCDGNPIVANHVIVEHRDGTLTKYWHLKTASVLVSVGETVVCGQALGLIGSSGNSSTPHLHFEVELPSGEVVDPYAGLESQPESRWSEQVGPFDLPGQDCVP